MHSRLHSAARAGQREVLSCAWAKYEATQRRCSSRGYHHSCSSHNSDVQRSLPGRQDCSHMEKLADCVSNVNCYPRRLEHSGHSGQRLILQACVLQGAFDSALAPTWRILDLTCEHNACDSTSFRAAEPLRRTFISLLCVTPDERAASCRACAARQEVTAPSSAAPSCPLRSACSVSKRWPRRHVEEVAACRCVGGLCSVP